MIFHSIDFLCLLAFVLVFYWWLPQKIQNIFLLLVSYFFYGYIHSWFLILITVSTLVDYGLGLLIVDAKLARRKMLLILSIVVNLGLLGFFKYFNFFAENLYSLLTHLGLQPPYLALEIVLPVGISFYTFQSLSYTIDIYRGKLQPTKNLIEFALFVSFFPHLVAGPIMRAVDLLPQVQRQRFLDWKQIESGIFLCLWGYFKKLVIADHVGLIANKVFSLPHPPFFLLWVGVFAFGIQIYSDFSAYSSIARGVARFLGFELMLNFDRPYLATSPKNFWTRWHISLSEWFRDYVYIPLGGNRGHHTRNLFLTFFLSGLWHGANWNFIIWGIYHASLIALQNLMAPLKIKLPEPVKILSTFLLVNLGWLFFREHNLSMILQDLSLNPFEQSFENLRLSFYLGMLACLYSLPLILEVFQERLLENFGKEYPLAEYLAGAAGFFAILIFRVPQGMDFIYFQF